MLMKRVLIVVFSLFTLLASAQWEYHPFVKEGKVWNMWGESAEQEQIGSHDFQYLMLGDTAIAGEAMKKVYLIDEYYFKNSNLHYIGAVKEVDRKVYIVYAECDTLTMLYDFGIDDYVTIMYEPMYGFIIDGWEKKHVCFNSTPRLFFLAWTTTGNKEQDTEFGIVEGVGSTYNIDPFRYKYTRKSVNRVKSCYEDKLCVFLFDEGFVNRVYSESYTPILKEGRTWKYRKSTTGNDYQSVMRIMGDTIIPRTDNQSLRRIYRKVYRMDEAVYGDKELHYYAAMRDAGRCIYQLPKDELTESRLPMFNFCFLGKREYYCINQEEINYVYAIKRNSITSKNRQYDMITLQFYEHQQPTQHFCHWIEGIGSDCGLLLSLPWDIEGSRPFEVFDNDVCIYDHAEVFPVTDAINDISSVASEQLSQVFDLQGRCLSSKPKRGMYIQNGKKYVVK